jgi:membrane protein DedA with SNARE-associated domain
VSGTFFSWIVTAISLSGYAGVIGLMALESACMPLPSEVIMPFSGYLASTGRFDLWLVATAGAVGCNVGSTIAYLVGAYGGRKAVLRWGHYVLFSAEELDRLDRFFHKYGSAAVLIGRLLPVVRTFISLPAGISQMPFLRFQIYTFRLVAVVSRARLYRRRARQRMGQQPGGESLVSPLRLGGRRSHRLRLRILYLAPLARVASEVTTLPRHT